jgi:hypothetical protein
MIANTFGTVWHCEQVVTYFGSIGYLCSEFNNPADYMLDVISGEEKTEVFVYMCVYMYGRRTVVQLVVQSRSQ